MKKAYIDFETYSPAGYIWNGKKFASMPGSRLSGIKAVGAARYTEHPEAEVLCLSYMIPGQVGHVKPVLWTPNFPLPSALFEFIENGGMVESWNVSFEILVWNNICVRKYNFPELHLYEVMCAAAKSRAYGLPSSLGKAGIALGAVTQKDKIGKNLIKKFCVPHTPTKKDGRNRIELLWDEEETLFYDYNMKDVLAHKELSEKIPDLSPDEFLFWQKDLIINQRGVQIDLEAINKCIELIEKCYAKYNLEMCELTDGSVPSGTALPKLKKWLETQGLFVEQLTAQAVAEFLKCDYPLDIKRALEIRQLLSSASIKKLYAMRNQVCEDGRLHDLFIYHAARTGRAAGSDTQPQNLPNKKKFDAYKCLTCGQIQNNNLNCVFCPADSLPLVFLDSSHDYEVVEDILERVKDDTLEETYGTDTLSLISACLRGLFIAKPDHDLIASDYSSIEAVVLAALAGEDWRLEVFRTHGQLYAMTTAMITGESFEKFLQHYVETGSHHPTVKKIGKVAELASGFGGGVGAWKRFGADEFFSDEEIRKKVYKWREASPAIVSLWEGLHWAALSAIQSPDDICVYRGIQYQVVDDVLLCRLPSGRKMAYHKPEITQGPRGWEITFEGWNANAMQGKRGWGRMRTYGGKLTENVVQACARDILANAIVNLENSGYPVVLHVHDEIVCEIPSFGEYRIDSYGSQTENAKLSRVDDVITYPKSIKKFEEIMSTMPSWAADWPIKAQGGWRGKRYRK